MNRALVKAVRTTLKAVTLAAMVLKPAVVLTKKVAVLKARVLNKVKVIQLRPLLVRTLTLTLV
nr:MAG TPA: hypothetical protein [Caudoviricetes sp.]